VFANKHPNPGILESFCNYREEEVTISKFSEMENGNEI
jgi:hypothetical protein